MFIVRFLALFQERGELVVKALIIPINFQLLSLSLWRIPACSKPEQAGVSKDGSLERLHIIKTFLNGFRTLPCSSHSWQPPEKLFFPPLSLTFLVQFCPDGTSTVHFTHRIAACKKHTTASRGSKFNIRGNFSARVNSSYCKLGLIKKPFLIGSFDFQRFKQLLASFS